MIFVYLQRSVVATKENIFHFKSIVSKVHYLERDGFFYFMETEIWKDIKGYEGMYQVSNFGRVASLPRQFAKSKSIRILKTLFTKDKYCTVGLCKNSIVRQITIHRLVAITFIENNDQSKIQVNHIDSNRINNYVSNLEWVSKRENVYHRNIKNYPNIKYIGVRHNGSMIAPWEFNIYVNGKRLVIRSFKTQEEAYLARRKMELDNKIVNKYSI